MFYLFTHSLVGWNLENFLKHAVSIFLRLSWHFKREKSFFKYKNWLHVQDFEYTIRDWWEILF